MKRREYPLPGKVAHRVLRPILGAYCDVRLSDHEIEILASDGVDLESVVSGRRVEIAGCKTFHGFGSRFGSLEPIDSLGRIIDSQVRPPERTVGVHIRRGDGASPIRYSPTHAFVRLMESEIRSDDRTEFFVASDSAEEVEHLSRLFPGRIGSYPKRAFRRDEPEAIQDALVDMHCLSRCRKVIGSFGSSFSDVAAHVGGIAINRARVFPCVADVFSGRIQEPDLIDDESLFAAVRRVRWARGVYCPECGGDQRFSLGPDSNRPELHTYYCRNCAQSYDDLSGTVFSGRESSLRTGLECLLRLGQGRSVAAVGQELGLTAAEIDAMVNLLHSPGVG